MAKDMVLHICMSCQCCLAGARTFAGLWSEREWWYWQGGLQVCRPRNVAQIPGRGDVF